MLSSSTALKIILSNCRPLQSEKVKLRNALGRTLARDVVAGENIPPFDNSAMDGFAIRATDVMRASHAQPVLLTVIGESSAGNPFSGKVENGTAVSVMTGAKIPTGADAVVAVEDVAVTSDQTVRVSIPSKPGSHIRRAGNDIKRKKIALRRGGLISPPRIGVLASLGCAKVRVTRRPTVNILATGDELAELRDELREAQIRNSNSYTLAAYVSNAGGDPTILGICPDKKKRLRKIMKEALQCDILLLSGGVSVGKYDFVKEVLTELGVETKFWQVNIKPGKPLVFGQHKKTLVFGLPGNPASVAVTFVKFVRPAIERLLGRNVAAVLQLSAVLDVPLKKNDTKRHFVRGICTTRKGILHVRTTGTQSSGALSSIAKANCLIVLPEATQSPKRGSRVTIELL